MQETTKSTATKTTTNTLGRRYLTEKELAEATGLALSTIRNQRSNRRGIPFIKMKKSVRYDWNDVVEYMNQNRVQTNTVY